MKLNKNNEVRKSEIVKTINQKEIKMKKIQKINGFTAIIEREKDAKKNPLKVIYNFTNYSSLKEAIKNMTDNGITHKDCYIGDDHYRINLEKTEEAIENEYENSMALDNNTPKLPTNMFK